MNPRTFLTTTSSALALALLIGVFLQQQQLTTLRAEQQQLTQSPASDEPAPAEVSAPLNPASPELLRLRGEVTRLAARRRELNSVSKENQALQNELAVMRTNSPGADKGPTVTLKLS